MIRLIAPSLSEEWAPSKLGRELILGTGVAIDTSGPRLTRDKGGIPTFYPSLPDVLKHWA